MHRRKALSRWRPAFCGILLMGVIVPGAVADNTIQIGVVIHLADVITGHWAQGEAEKVTARLVNRLVEQLNREHPHWNFSPGATPASPVAVEVNATEGGSNEMLLKVELRLRVSGGHVEVVALGEAVLYEPGHFAAFGRPTGDEAENDVWKKLDPLLALSSKPSLKILSEQVPVALNPSAIQMPERTVVLPLPKDRYSRLAWSTFWLHCQGQQTPKLDSQANNEWSQYGPNLPIALKVTVVGNIPTLQLQGLKPILVYLKEYIPKIEIDWLSFDDGGNNP